MGDVFSAQEKLQNIIYVIQSLNELHSNCEEGLERIYIEAVQKQLANLDQAVLEIKVVE